MGPRLEPFPQVLSSEILVGQSALFREYSTTVLDKSFLQTEADTPYQARPALAINGGLKIINDALRFRGGIMKRSHGLGRFKQQDKKDNGAMHFTLVDFRLICSTDRLLEQKAVQELLPVAPE